MNGGSGAKLVASGAKIWGSGAKIWGSGAKIWWLGFLILKARIRALELGFWP